MQPELSRSKGQTDGLRGIVPDRRSCIPIKITERESFGCRTNLRIECPMPFAEPKCAQANPDNGARIPLRSGIICLTGRPDDHKMRAAGARVTVLRIDRLTNFISRHADARAPLEAWLQTVEA